VAALLAFQILWPGEPDEGPGRAEELGRLLAANGFGALAVARAGSALEASGEVDSDADLGRLVELVKGQPTKVFLRISVRRDILEAAREALASYGFYPAMSFGGDGRPVVAVYMRDPEVEERAFALLARDVPALAAVRAVVHRGSLEPVVRRTLSEAGLGALEVVFGEGRLELTVPPGFQGASALARALQRAAGLAGVPVVYALHEGSVADGPAGGVESPATVFEASAAGPEPAEGPAEKASSPLGLIEVAGVTLSPMRFVSTRDGQKLFEGSPLPGGWVITAIGADSLTLSREEEAVVIELAPGGAANP
jgi:type III secretion protein D